MSINNLNTYLNVRDAHLRVVSGNVYAQAMNIGGINVETAHGLQSVSDTGNVTSNTLQFSNATTGFVTTANAQIGRDLVVTGNATVSTDLTVSANATVTDTLTVSEHLLASKEATVTGNLHVTTIMSDSNVVAEYTGPHDRPLRKYPEVAIINGTLGPTGGIVQTPGVSESQKGYTVTSSSSWGNGGTDTRAAWCAFDEGKSTTTYKIWQSGNYYTTATPGVYNRSPAQSHTANGVNYEGEWIKLELPRKINISEIEINATAYSSLTGHVAGRPYEGAILGSNDDSNWSLLKSFSGGLSWATTTVAEGGGRATLTPDTNTTNKYRYIMLVVNKVQGSRSSVDINEIRYYGYEEGSASLDTTLKTVYNVPATTGTQLEVYYDGRETSSYPESGGTTVYDISPNTNNGTLNGGVGFDSTYKAFTFDGTTTRNITTTLPSSVTGEYVHSVSLWVKADEVSRTSSGMFTFFTIGSASSANMIALGVNTSVDGIKYDFYDASANVLYNPPITSNEWMHFVVTYSGGANNLPGAKRIYLNGKELSVSYGGGSSSSPLSLTTSPTLTLGGQLNSGNPPFSGSIANFRLYSKALNADQVKELYDYQKDYFLGSKSQVTLYKGHLGVGVTEPSGQLELAGDERIQAYPPRGMTHTDGTATGSQAAGQTKNITYIEGHGEFKASASLRSRQDVDYDGQQPYNAFDYTSYSHLLFGPGSGEDVGYNKTTGYYEDNEYRLSASSGTPYGHWLQLEMPYKINVKSYFIQHVANDYWPQDWQIWASNDDINWTHIHTYTDGTFDTDPQYYTVSHTGHYKIYTMIITRIKEGSTLDRVRIQELRYFGTPGPTTLDKGSLTLGRSLDVPRISRYDVDTETPRPEKLVLDFDTTVNSSPTDISGQGNHGTFKGTASYSPAEKAFFFDGNSDYIQGTLNLNGSELDGSYTLSAWVKRSSTTNTESFLFYIGTDGTGDSIGFYSDSATSYKLFHYNATTAYATSQPSILNTYRHIVATYDGTYRRIYIDGVMVDVTNTGVSAPLGIPNNPTFSLGMRYTNLSDTQEFLHGYMSNPKIYSVALEPSEVKKLYKLGRTGRSMVISDTAVGIGKVPEAQLDVRGNLKLNGLVMPHIIAGSWRMTGGNPSTTTIYLNEGNCVKAISNQNVAGQGNGVSGNRGQFTAPVTGLYNISFNFIAGTRNSSNYLGSYSASGGAILTSPMGSYREMFDMRSTDNVQESYAYTMCATMDAGDIVKFSTYSSSYVDSGALIVGSAHLIYAIPRATW